MQRNTEAASEMENDVRAENARKSELLQNEGLLPDRYIDEEPNLAAYDFGEAVSHGLTLQPKRIASKWLYDREGSRLFDEIVATPYYYVPRAEVSILKKYGAMISEVVGPGASLVELGSGSSTKVRVLLDALSLRCYIPVEISEAQLREASDAIRRDYPALKVHPIAADYTTDFELPGTVREGRLIGFFPGSTLCNLLPHNSVNFLRRMKTVLGPDSVFLVGVDLKKDRTVMLRAYNDPEGPIWHFNLNILDRMNRELGCNLDKANFRHEAIYNEAEGRMEAAIYSLCHQEVHLDEGSYTLTAGEPIVLEYSHKYHIKEFQDLAREAGWTPLHVWSDQEDLFSVHLLAG